MCIKIEIPSYRGVKGLAVGFRTNSFALGFNLDCFSVFVTLSIASCCGDTDCWGCCTFGGAVCCCGGVLWDPGCCCFCGTEAAICSGGIWLGGGRACSGICGANLNSCENLCSSYRWNSLDKNFKRSSIRNCTGREHWKTFEWILGVSTGKYIYTSTPTTLNLITLKTGW